jgi:hypothetical protein
MTISQGGVLHDGNVAPMTSEHALAEAQAALAGGDAAKSIIRLSAIINGNPACAEALALRGRAFELAGCPEEALRDYKRARVIGPAAHWLSAAEASAQSQVDEHIDRCRKVTCIGEFRVMRCLGVGWEGAVYRCRDPQGIQHIVKRFHPHRTRMFNEGVDWVAMRPEPAAIRLIALAAALRRDPHPGLYAFEPLLEDGRLVGIHYRGERLYPVHAALLSQRSSAAALLHTAMAIQAYLLTRLQMVVSDLLARQFMVSWRGQLRLIDYGGTLLRVSDPRCAVELHHVVTLGRLLHETVTPAGAAREHFKQQLAVAQTRGPEAVAAVFRDSESMRAGVQRFPALKPLLEHAARADFDAFNTPEIYQLISAKLPSRVATGQCARGILSDVLRRGGGMLRKRRKRGYAGAVIKAAARVEPTPMASLTGPIRSSAPPGENQDQ